MTTIGSKGKCVIFCAPSGTGKSTIVKWLMNEHSELRLAFSISCTSRAPRGNERNGVEYFFISPEEFRERIARKEFLEHEQVYANIFYGTLISQVDSQLDKGRNVVFDVDVNGGLRIKKYYQSRALSLFIEPPSMETLRQRLTRRATDAPAIIEERLRRAAYELSRAPLFDRRIINDDLSVAEQSVYEAVKNFVRGC